MPHRVEVEVSQSTRVAQTRKSKVSSSRELRQLQNLYSQTRDQYLSSKLSLTITHLLLSKNFPTVTKLVSLGLGSLQSKDQSRRLKQLTIFLAIASQLRQNQPNLKLYAQDPAFSKLDSAFLQSLGIQILTTPTATEAGESKQYIDEQTLVYCPFLTLEAYQLFFGIGKLGFFLGDDFDALRLKWSKHSAGWKEAEALERQYVKALRKRVMGDGEGFWEQEDRPFPMAMYWTPSLGNPKSIL